MYSIIKGMLSLRMGGAGFRHSCTYLKVMILNKKLERVGIKAKILSSCQAIFLLN